MFVCLFAKGRAEAAKRYIQVKVPQGGEFEEAEKETFTVRGEFSQNAPRNEVGGGFAQKLQKKWHIYVTCTFQPGGRGGKAQ